MNGSGDPMRDALDQLAAVEAERDKLHQRITAARVILAEWDEPGNTERLIVRVMFALGAG